MNTVYAVIGVMVALVMVGCCLVPIVQDSVTGYDETRTATYNNSITPTKYVYQMQSGDSVLLDGTNNKVTVTADGTTYDTTDDALLLAPEEATISADITNGLVKFYESDGITEYTTAIKITQISATEDTTWLLDSDGHVWGTGSGNFGQQGDSDTSTNVTSFTDRTPTGTTITAIACSSSTTWLLDSDGHAWGTGRNNYGQQGDSDTSTNVTSFTDRTPTGTTITAIACYTTQTLLLDSSGKIWFAGAKPYATGSTNISTFTDLTPTGTTITAIACNESIMTLDSDGHVWMLGKNTYGQQGSGTTSSTAVSTLTDRTPTGTTITAIACSFITSWLLDSDGHAWGTGQNTGGQQGDSDTSTNVTSFTDRTPTGTTITAIACNQNTTWLLDSDGHAWGTGYGGNYQQGSNSTADVTSFTDRTPTGTTITAIACSSSTTWLLDSDGHAWGTGSGNFGQQGSGTSSNKSFTDMTPTGTTITAIACSPSTTWLLDSDGHAWGTGRNNYGQQGDSDTSTNVTSFTEHSLDPTDISITYADTTITIDTDTAASSVSTLYLISTISSLTSSRLYIPSTSADQIYADPSTVISYYVGDTGYYEATGATISTTYGLTDPTVTENSGTATDLSSVYLYTGAPVTASTDTWGMIIDTEYTGEYTVHVGGLDNDLWTLLATLTVTIAILGIVLAAVRSLGGRE